MKYFKPVFIIILFTFLFSGYRIERDFVEEKLSEMTMREKISQMIVTYSDGYSIGENSSEFQRLKYLVETEKVGGVIFFKGNSLQETELINKLQKLAETPLLISSDFERGTAMRLDDGSLFPNNMAIGATGNPMFAYQMGIAIAKECRAMGIHQNYAPVVDVNSNPKNPIINVRSFGENPDEVAKYGKMLVQGLQDGNVIATGKHFPGHGDTDIDSHNDLPVITKELDALRNLDIVPFKNVIDAGVMSIMAAHVAFPALENNKNVPASLSQNVVTKLLKEELGFKGLVVTDALNMAGIIKHFTTEQVALMCVDAGIDLILMPQGEQLTIDVIEKAVNDGKIRPDRIESSARKILEAKKWLGLNSDRFTDIEKVKEIVNSSEIKTLAQDIADASITLVKDDFNSVPFVQTDIPKSCLVVSFENTGDSKSSDLFLQNFEENSGGFFYNISSFRITSDKFDDTEILKFAKDANFIVIPIFSKVKMKTGTVGIPNSQVELIKKLNANKNTVVISYGNPYLIQGFENISSYIAAYGDAPCSVIAGIKTLFGFSKFSGKLPISVTKELKSGTGIIK